MLYLNFGCKVQVFHAPLQLCLLMWSLSESWSLGARVRWRWDTQCPKSQNYPTTVFKRLASAFFGNTLLYPVSVSNWTGTKNDVLVIQLMTSLQKAPCYLLTYEVLNPTPPPHHTPENHTPKQRCLPPYPIILSISLYFCGIRKYFLQILIVSDHGVSTALSKILLGFFWFLFVYINVMSYCSWKP